MVIIDDGQCLVSAQFHVCVGVVLCLMIGMKSVEVLEMCDAIEKT